MSEQDKEMEASFDSYVSEARRCCEDCGYRALNGERAFKAGWKAASERKDAEIERLKKAVALADEAIATGKFDGFVEAIQRSKLATALEALEFYALATHDCTPLNPPDPSLEWDAGKRAREALALIRGEK